MYSIPNIRNMSWVYIMYIYPPMDMGNNNYKLTASIVQLSASYNSISITPNGIRDSTPQSVFGAQLNVSFVFSFSPPQTNVTTAAWFCKYIGKDNITPDCSLHSR